MATFSFFLSERGIVTAVLTASVTCGSVSPDQEKRVLPFSESAVMVLERERNNVVGMCVVKVLEGDAIVWPFTWIERVGKDAVGTEPIWIWEGYGV